MTGHPRLSRCFAAQLKILDWPASSQNLLQHRFKDWSELWQHFAHCLANVFVGRQTIDLGQRFIDLNVAQLLVQHRQPRGGSRKKITGSYLAHLTNLLAPAPPV